MTLPVRNVKHCCARWLTSTVCTCMFVTTNNRVPDIEPPEVPINRAVTRSGKDGDSDITQLSSRFASCSPDSKATAIRDIDANTHTYHVPWKTGGTEIRAVQDRSGRYVRTDRCPNSVNRAGAPGRDHVGWTGHGAPIAPTSGPNARSVSRVGGAPPRRHGIGLSADPHSMTVTSRRHTGRDAISGHGRTALGALPISAERLTSDDAHLVVHRIHEQHREHQPDTPR